MSTPPPQNAILTDASRGIDRAVALRLARNGFAVVVNYAGAADKTAAVVKEIAAHGGRAIAVQADVADAPDRSKISMRSSTSMSAPSMRCSRRPSALPTAAASSPCSTSVLGMSFPCYATYAASKAAVEVLTGILTHELRGRHVASMRSRQTPPRSSCSSTGWRNLRRWSGPARLKTSPMWSPSWPDRKRLDQRADAPRQWRLYLRRHSSLH